MKSFALISLSAIIAILFIIAVAMFPSTNHYTGRVIEKSVNVEGRDSTFNVTLSFHNKKRVDTTVISVDSEDYDSVDRDSIIDFSSYRR